MAKKTDKASVTVPVEANVPTDENVTTDALPLTDENTAPESHSDDAATNDAPANDPPANDTPAKEDEPVDDGLVDVSWHDGSDFTFDLTFANRRISFIDGVARVPQALADALRAGGYVK